MRGSFTWGFPQAGASTVSVEAQATKDERGRGIERDFLAGEIDATPIGRTPIGRKNVGYFDFGNSPNHRITIEFTIELQSIVHTAP